MFFHKLSNVNGQSPEARLAWRQLLKLIAGALIA
jgi:hypothetical protein